MKETDQFERIEWTPPILGWHYRMEWEEQRDGLRRVYMGISDREIQGITISARIEPRIRSYWGITMHGLSKTRTSSDLHRVIEMVEADIEQIEEWLAWLKQ